MFRHDDGLHGDGHEEIELISAIDPLKSRRCDSDYLERTVIETDGCPDDVGPSAEGALPESIAQHDDVHRIGASVFVRREEPSQ